MNYKELSIFVILYVLILGLNAQNGNKDYSDSPISNNGPNIILINVDDLGYGDLGDFWQNQRISAKKMTTPRLDAMANEGAMLTHHYAAAPVCAPSRASLLAGLHQGHTNIRNNQFDKPLNNGLNMAQLLSLSGYRTMHVGKAGLAGGRGSSEPDPATLPAHPLKRGFDQFYGYLYHIQGHQHYPQDGTTAQRAYFVDGYSMIMENTGLTYSTDVFTAKSKDWIVTHENTRPEQPFFLYLAYDAPHATLQVPTQAYPAGGGLSGGLQWTGANNAVTPWVNTASGTRDSYIHSDYDGLSWNETEKRHATMIRRIDDAVGDLIQLLKDLNIDDNTLIVFTSDNGPHHENGSGGTFTQNPQSFQSYGNMNGTKRDLWEAGVKVPTICRFPNTIPSNSVVTFPSGHWDWLATFADLANVPIPAYTDGVSVFPSLKQDNNNQIDKGYTYHEYYFNGNTKSYSDFEPSKRNRVRRQMQVIRMGNYKGVRYNITSHNTPFEIYDVVLDERESTNLASTMPELEQKMRDKVLQVRKRESSASRPYDSEFIPSVEVSGLISGLIKKRYSGNYNWVPNFEYLLPTDNSVVSGLDLVLEGNSSEIGLYYKGYIKIPSDGLYTFYNQSESNSHIMLHDIHLIDNDFNYTSNELSETIYLKSGFHPIRIFYQQSKQATPNMTLKLSGPGMAKTDIPDNMFYIDSTLEAKELLFNYNVSFFINPVDDILKIKIQRPITINYKVSMFSALGKQVLDYNTVALLNKDKDVIDIPTNNLKSGIYFLKVTFDNNKSIVKKVVKK
ncbi:sulfatase-like hydrolase/transferase [uncultured Wocania sp.]|uniref:sulfatase-like hydrolase/transferase n=1 Tax=uncultured Wocania sp. TaxID=2834404 RepID=UPI0030F4BF1A